MTTRDWTVAVTALNATDNPAPGVGVARSLRQAADFGGRIVGLTYDALDPGIYARDVVDDVFLIPYPSQGLDALEVRLRYIHDQVGLDVIVPTVDAELDAFITLSGRLADLGIRMLLPTPEQLALRAKNNLARLGEEAGIPTPTTRVVGDVAELYSIHEQIPYPLYLKGQYYGARLARSVDEAVHAFHAIVAEWGLPVIAQRAVDGEEYDVVAVGDGRGGTVGAVPMKKTYLTDKGKGWAGVAVADPELHALTRRFMEATRWRGPCEVELCRGPGGDYHLLEVNPRFPAWCYLSAGAGMNLPWAAVRMAAGETLDPLTDYRVGTMFVRISLDQIADISQLQQIASTGEIRGVSGATVGSEEER
jgi:carbamoyl-phosphate synthase large subunit